MAIDLHGLDHSCNVIRRKIEEEFKDLRLVFLVHRDGTLKRSVKSQRTKIATFPCGRDAIDLLDNKNENDPSEFLGILIDKPSGLKKLFKPTLYTAVFCINADRFLANNNVTQHIYHLVWHAIKLLNDMRESSETCSLKGNLLQPNIGKIDLAHNNLMADVFSAILMESIEHDGYIVYLAEKRTTDTLNKTAYYNAKYYPYPLAVEACQLVYDEYYEDTASLKKPVTQALQLAQEVATTYAESAIRQWWAFSEPAQQMAWMGYTINDILGAALFTSEDPYVRSAAHLVAELMDINPKPISNMSDYNPFTDFEANDRLHQRKCDYVWKKLETAYESSQDISAIYKEAKLQYIALLNAHPNGWCAHAILKAAKTLQAHSEDSDAIDHARETFYNALPQINWTHLSKLQKIIIRLSVNQQELDIETLLGDIEKSEGLECMAQPLKTLNLMVQNDEELQKEQNEEEQQEPLEIMNISGFVHSPNIQKKADTSGF